MEVKVLLLEAELITIHNYNVVKKRQCNIVERVLDLKLLSLCSTQIFSLIISVTFGEVSEHICVSSYFVYVYVCVCV